MTWGEDGEGLMLPCVAGGVSRYQGAGGASKRRRDVKLREQGDRMLGVRRQRHIIKRRRS